jgi:hypothetical protein
MPSTRARNVGGDGDDRHHRDEDREHAPERELTPHAAAIDDQVGIERHRTSPRFGGQWALSLVTVNGAQQHATIVANEMEMRARVRGAAQQ